MLVVDVNGDGVGDAPGLLALAGPFEPWLVVAERGFEQGGLLRRQGAAGGGVQERFDPVGLARGVKAQRGGEVGVVGPFQRGFPRDLAAGREAAISLHRYVHPGQSLTIGRDRREYKELDKKNAIVETYDNTPRQKPETLDSKTPATKTFRDLR